MRNPATLAVLTAVIVAGGCTTPLVRRHAKAPALAHNVYFTLRDNSPAARARLVGACYRYLKDHLGG